MMLYVIHSGEMLSVMGETRLVLLSQGLTTQCHNQLSYLPNHADYVVWCFALQGQNEAQWNEETGHS